MDQFCPQIVQEEKPPGEKVNHRVESPNPVRHWEGGPYDSGEHSCAQVNPSSSGLAS